MYKVIWAQVAIAYMLDLAFGEPKRVPHPTELIGRLINILARAFNKKPATALVKRILGVLAVMITVGATYFLTWLIVVSVTHYNYRLGFIISIILISMTIATRGLMDNAREVAQALRNNDIENARILIARIVGCDTASMKRRDIVRTIVEHVAEKSVNGVIAPILYALIGGAPLAMAYIAVNTLDSMIGSSSDDYHDFGFSAARLSDVVDFVPARISIGIIALGALIIGKNSAKAMRIAWRDGRKYGSINSGYPEAAVAGAVGLRLGGTNYYEGVPRVTAQVGDGKGALTEKHINEVVVLLFVTSAVTLLVARAVLYIISLAH